MFPQAFRPVRPERLTRPPKGPVTAIPYRDIKRHPRLPGDASILFLVLLSEWTFRSLFDYIIPIPPPMPPFMAAAAAAGSSFLISAMPASVVSSRAEAEAAF